MSSRNKIHAVGTVPYDASTSPYNAQFFVYETANVVVLRLKHIYIAYIITLLFSVSRVTLSLGDFLVTPLPRTYKPASVYPPIKWLRNWVVKMFTVREQTTGERFKHIGFWQERSLSSVFE